MGTKVHCQISHGKQNNNIRYFANNVTVVDEQRRSDGPGGDGTSLDFIAWDKPTRK